MPIHSSAAMELRGHLAKGLAAGLIGGLVASWTMSQFHMLAGKLTEDSQKSGSQQEEDSTVKTASAISQTLLHHQLADDEKKIAGPAVHYTFGATSAAVYGAAVELIPTLSAGAGLPFGTAVWLGAHVIMVPALGLSKPVTESTLPKEATELGAHFVYGAVTELVRRILRKWLG